MAFFSRHSRFFAPANNQNKGRLYKNSLYSIRSRWLSMIKLFACTSNIIDRPVNFWLLACVGQMIIRILAHLSSLIFKIVTMQIMPFFEVYFTQAELRRWNTPTGVWAFQISFLKKQLQFCLHFIFMFSEFVKSKALRSVISAR
jgi:hypothetical protein